MDINAGELFSFVISALLYQFPFLTVLIIGIIYSVINFSKNPTLGRPVLIGLLTMLAINVIWLFSPYLISRIFTNYGADGFYAYAVWGVSIILSILHAAAFGLILHTVWRNRQPE